MNHYQDAQVGEEIILKKDAGKYLPLYYAGASGDFNPIHIDADFARMVGLKENILQGLCTYAFCQQCVTDWIGNPAMLKKLSVRFRGNVLPNDKVTIKAKITEKTVAKITLSIEAEKQTGEVVISNGVAEIELPSAAKAFFG